MKFKKITGKQATADATLVGGAVVGAMVARGAVAVIAKPAGDTPTAAEKSKKTYIKLGLAAAAAFGFMSIDAKDTVSEAASGACLGIAVDNALSGISDLMASNSTVTAKLATDTTSNRFLKGAIGLSCPCQTTTSTSTMPIVPASVAQLNRGRSRALRLPEVPMLQIGSNPLDEAYKSALSA